MAEICRGVVGEGETTSPASCEPSTRAARRRRMEIRGFRFVASSSEEEDEPRRNPRKRCESEGDGRAPEPAPEMEEVVAVSISPVSALLSPAPSAFGADLEELMEQPKFGVVSVCGRRRDMEDAVAVHPAFCRLGPGKINNLHFFGVYDGHGCSHVAKKCRDRMHVLVREELEAREFLGEWEAAMGRSFSRMDEEAAGWKESLVDGAAPCRCNPQKTECDAVGSTAVVSILTPERIVVANCGDSRAILCRNGKAVPLSSDHKPDRPDELKRIQDAGGRVFYWDGARVLGVLAMSRAIGDNFLKPYVSCEPEVSVTDRTAEDECLILASDGLWDVISNEMACGVARMCLRGNGSPSKPSENGADGGISDKMCSDASTLLAKLALARRSTDNISVVVVDLRRNP